MNTPVSIGAPAQDAIKLTHFGARAFAISATSFTAFRKLRFGVIGDYTPKLRPSGDQIYLKVNLVLMFLNCSN